MDEKKLELLKKLKALAERGVGGEKETAQKKLEQLMKKYKVEEEDLSDDKLIDFDFRYTNDFEYRLLTQLFFKIADDRDKYHYTRGKGQKTVRGIQCTKAEGLQIQIEYDFYRQLWREECDFFFRAFIQKHSIFGESKGGGTRMSREDILRMNAMMEGMQDKQMLLRLEGGDQE